MFTFTIKGCKLLMLLLFFLLLIFSGCSEFQEDKADKKEVTPKNKDIEKEKDNEAQEKIVAKFWEALQEGDMEEAGDFIYEHENTEKTPVAYQEEIPDKNIREAYAEYCKMVEVEKVEAVSKEKFSTRISYPEWKWLEENYTMVATEEWRNIDTLLENFGELLNEAPSDTFEVKAGLVKEDERWWIEALELPEEYEPYVFLSNFSKLREKSTAVELDTRQVAEFEIKHFGTATELKVSPDEKFVSYKMAAHLPFLSLKEIGGDNYELEPSDRSSRGSGTWVQEKLMYVARPENPEKEETSLVIYRPDKRNYEKVESEYILDNRLPPAANMENRHIFAVAQEGIVRYCLDAEEWEIIREMEEERNLFQWSNKASYASIVQENSNLVAVDTKTGEKHTLYTAGEEKNLISYNWSSCDEKLGVLLKEESGQGLVHLVAVNRDGKELYHREFATAPKHLEWVPGEDKISYILGSDLYLECIEGDERYVIKNMGANPVISYSCLFRFELWISRDKIVAGGPPFRILEVNW